MNHPQHLFIKDYSYDLPDERIAKHPLPQRDASKLLIYDQGKISEDIFRNLSDHIPENALLIFNNTKVINARLLFQKSTGGVIEIFCLEPHLQYNNISTAMQQHNEVLWECLIGGASKWKHGQILQKKIQGHNKEFMLEADYVEKFNDSFIIRLSWNDPALSFAEVLHYSGAIPLPPYIKREVEQEDKERYQTIYADTEGSVAAPTAGLHFTEKVFSELKKKNIETDFITLHVGAGTFKPVKSETIGAHEMHAEFIEVSPAIIKKIKNKLNEDIIPVGTTSLRTIESLYWLGVKIIANKNAGLHLSQWEPYELRNDIAADEALQALLKYMQEKKIDKLITQTQIIIAPPYKPKIATALITNFHQPQSTLLLLVSAFAGKNWKKIYEYALANDFRFLSYGDSCLIRREQH